MNKIKVYFIEYKNYIKFFGLNNNRITIVKNSFTYDKIQKLIKNNNFVFVNLLEKN